MSCKFRGSGCFFEDLVVNLDDHETSCMFRSVRYALLWILSLLRLSSFLQYVPVPYLVIGVILCHLCYFFAHFGFNLTGSLQLLVQEKAIAVLRYLSYHLDRSTIPGNAKVFAGLRI